MIYELPDIPVWLEDGTLNPKIKPPWNEPYLLRGFCKGIPAIKKWTPEYLKKNMNNVWVGVETYKKFEDFETSTAELETLRFDDFVDNYMTKQFSYTPDLQLYGDHHKDVHPQLFTDLTNPNDLRIGLTNGDDVLGIPDEYNLYIGNNTKTGQHVHVEDDFMLNQVIGSKDIWFTDWNMDDFQLKPFHTKYNNFAEQNFFKLLRSGFFDKGGEGEHISIYHAKLNPGDSVTIPPWWWHMVQSDGFTIGNAKIWERDGAASEFILYYNEERFHGWNNMYWKYCMSSGMFDWFVNLSKKFNRWVMKKFPKKGDVVKHFSTDVVEYNTKTKHYEINNKPYVPLSDQCTLDKETLCECHIDHTPRTADGGKVK